MEHNSTVSLDEEKFSREVNSRKRAFGIQGPTAVPHAGDSYLVMVGESLLLDTKILYETITPQNALSNEPTCTLGTKIALKKVTSTYRDHT